MDNSNRRNRALLSVAALIAATIGASVILQPAAHSEQPSLIRDQVLRHEQLVADCMKERGFEYAVTVPGDLLVEEARAAAEADGRDIRAAVEQASAARGTSPSPNELLVAGLEPRQQQAWGDALWGTDDTAGCMDSTLQAAARVDVEAGLRRAEAILAQAKSDPTVQSAERTYVACMTTQGYAVTSVDGIHEYVGRRAEVLSEEAGQKLTDTAYARHDACVRPYNQTFNATHLRLLGGR